MIGGLGTDIVHGGWNEDYFGLGIAESGPDQWVPDRSRDRIVYTFFDGQPDTVTGFGSDRDLIDLHRADADVVHEGNQAFHFIGDTSFSGHPGELAFHSDGWSRPTLEGDIDGNGYADLILEFVQAVDLTAANFRF